MYLLNAFFNLVGRLFRFSFEALGWKTDEGM